MSTSSPPSTEHALDRSLVTGMAWTAAAKWVAQILSWVATLYAARRLLPADYGIVAMATIPIGLVRMVEDFGLDAVLVQNRSISGDDQARLAGLALAVGCGAALLFVALAYPVAAFFAEPMVASLVMALSLLFILDALQIVPKAGLTRNLEFKRLAFVSFIQSAVTSGALITFSTLSFGHWSLVLNSLSGAVAATLALIFWHRFRIAWPSRLASLTAHLKQGWRVLMTRASWYAYVTADQTIIGKMLGKEALGVYSFASTFANMPVQEITSTVTKVVPGIFSRVQDDQGALRRYFLVLNEFIAYLAFPATVGIALTADVAMAVVLGPEWEAVVLPLQILSIYAGFNAAQSLMSHALTWTGQFRAQMWCSILTAAVLPIGLLLAAPHGLPAIAWAWAILYPLTNIPQIVIAFRTVGITLGEWIGAMWPAISACIGMAVAVLTARYFLHAHPSHYLSFGVQVAVGAAAYVAILWFVYRARIQAMIATVKAATRSQPEPAIAG